MSEPLKIVVSGPVGAGKTTLTETLSESHALNTDEFASDRIGKATTTVALDFAVLLGWLNDLAIRPTVMKLP